MSDGSCKSFERRVSALVDGEITAAERHEVEAHLDRCESCATLAATFREIHLRAGGQAVPPVSPAEWALFREGLARRMESPAPRAILRFIPGRWLLAGAAAAALIAAAGVWLLSGGPEPPLESYAEWREGAQPTEIEVDDETLYIKYEEF
jgi:anti-sigma factor RsiW